MRRRASIDCAFEFRIDALDHHAARVAAAGKQHRQINRGRDAAHAGDVAQLFGERAIILDAFRAGRVRLTCAETPSRRS